MKTITAFWKHFQKNNFVFLLLNEIPRDELKSHLNKLLEILHLYNEDLDFIIKNKKNKAELIITANGNPYLFKEVELLIYHAPDIERWKITALLQPTINLSKFEKATDRSVEYYGISLRISEMYFIVLESPHKPTDLGIKVLIKSYIVHKDNPKLREAVYAILEHLLGEKIFANEIAFIDIGQIEAVDDFNIELYHLKQFIETLPFN